MFIIPQSLSGIWCCLSGFCDLRFLLSRCQQSCSHLWSTVNGFISSSRIWLLARGFLVPYLSVTPQASSQHGHLLHQSKQVSRARRERNQQGRVTVAYNLIQVTPHHLHHILFSRRDTLDPAHTSGLGVYADTVTTGWILSSCPRRRDKGKQLPLLIWTSAFLKFMWRHLSAKELRTS